MFVFKQNSSIASAFLLLIFAILACESDSVSSTGSVSISPTSVSTVSQPAAPPQLTLPPSTKAPVPSPTAATAVPSVTAEVVQKDGYFVVVAAIEDPANPSVSYKAENGKRLIAIEVIAGNISGRPWVVTTNNVTLLDADGQVYKAGMRDRDGELPGVRLDVGERVRGWLSFKIPVKAVAKSIKWELSVFTDSSLSISLAQSSSGKVDLKLPERVKPKLARLGEVVQQSGYSLSAISVEDPTKGGVWYAAEAGKKLVGVEIVVANVSGKQFRCDYSWASVVDKDGFVYTPESTLSSRDGQLPSLDLSPTEKARGWVSFKIPEQANMESIKYYVLSQSVSLQTGLEK